MKIIMSILVLSIVIEAIRVRKRSKKKLLLDREIHNHLERQENIRN